MASIGSIMATMSGSISLWQLPEGRSLQTFGEHPLIANSLAFTQDNTKLAAGSQEKIEIWDLHNNRLHCILKEPHLAQADGIVFSDDGETIVTVGSDAVHLWSVADGRYLRKLQSITGVYGVSLAPDGQSLATIADQAVWLMRCLCADSRQNTCAEPQLA
jgi:WD40 repeat protein